VIAETCDRVAVMYAGRIVEVGPVHQVINHPEHPYTAGLMASIPDMEVDRERLNQIDGAMPRLNAIPKGCAFNPRCTKVFERCKQERPELTQVTQFDQSGQTHVACWLQSNTTAEAVR
jgi:peptide/nickel transport system ATP-binding protein